MKEIRIFLASSYELEPDRARIGNLIRRLNDKYEARHIYLKLEKWEDVESFYNGGSKQGEYDHLIRRSQLFVGLFWHCAGMYTVHEVDVARANLPPENVLIFRKTAPFREDHEGSEDVKRFRERFPDEELFKSEAEMDDYLAKQETVFQYKTFPELGDVLSKKIEEYCASVTVTEEEKARTYSRNTLQIHVAASPEVEPDAARLGDLVRYLDENSRYYCRIRMIDALPGSDMFVSMCHTSAPVELRNEIDAAVRANGDPANNGRPRLFFCMKYLESGTPKDPSLEELEKQFGSVLSHYPDQYAHAPELKLHFMLQLERLQKERAHSDAMLVVKDGVIYQKNGETESPLMSCEDMGSLQKDKAYGEMKRHLNKLRTDLEELKERDRNSEQDLSKEIHRLYQEITEVEERIKDKQNGYLRLARTLEEMVGQEQDKEIQRVRELFRDGKVDEALKLLPAPDDQRREREERKRRHEAEDLRAYNVCNLTIDCLQAGNALKNRQSIFNQYELLIDIADDLRDEEKKGEACFDYARFLHDVGFYDKSLEYYEKTLNILLRTSGRNCTDVVLCYNNIGGIYLRKKMFNESLNCFNNAISILSQLPEKDQLFLVTCYSNMGLLWAQKGDYDKALKYYEKIKDVILHVCGKDHFFIAIYYSNVGSVLEKNGKYDEALENFEKALRIQLRAQGMDSLEVSSSYANIGQVWADKGYYGKALENYIKALDIRLRVQGEDHPDVAQCFNNIGTVLEKMGNDEDALGFFQKNLAILLRVFGENNSNVAQCYTNIGVICRKKGDYDSALFCYEKALSSFLQAWGEIHPDVAQCYNNIGVVLNKKDECDEALKSYEKALAIRLRLFDKNHPDVAQCYNNIGNIFFKRKNYEKAIDYYEKALSSLRHAFCDNHPVVAGCYNNIGNVYCEEENYDKAVYYYKMALSSCRNALGENHPTVAGYYYNIGVVLKQMDAPDEVGEKKEEIISVKENDQMGIGHKDEAEEYFAKARAIAQNFPGNAFCRMILEELSGEDEQ